MVNVLSTDKQIAVIGALAEGSSIRSMSHDTDNPQEPTRHVTVLHIGPVTSAVLAVKAAIVQEFKSSEPEEA